MTKIKKKIYLLSIVLLAAIVVLLIHHLHSPSFVGSETIIYDNDIHKVAYFLNNFTTDEQGNTLGARENSLFKVVDNGKSNEFVYEFSNKVNAIHVMRNGSIFVATDDNWWDPETPCKIYRSFNSGKSFEIVKVIEKSSVLWWSIASDNKGNLFIGEYGPKEKNLSKNVWKSTNNGDTWSIIFRASNIEGTHIHRVAVDPFTDFLWITHGDREDGIYMSSDGGLTFEKRRDSQATSVAFTKEAIYWGEDEPEGIITRYDRSKKSWETVFNASKMGPYGGSIYDMAVGHDGLVYVPLVKYPQRDHLASFWSGSGKDWQLLMTAESKKGKWGGSNSIGGPDKYGMLYIYDFKIDDRNRKMRVH